jgi:phosphate transport system protein
MPAGMQDLIEQLRAEAARMAGLVQQSVTEAVDAVVRGDTRLAQNLIALDEKIDTAEVKIEKKAIDLLSLHQPAAGEFRLVLMVIKVNNELERVADCATNISERVGQLAAEFEAAGEAYQLPPELVQLGQEVVAIVRQTVRAFNFAEVDAAQEVIKADDRVDALYAGIVQQCLSDMRRESAHVSRDLAHVMIAKNLERIGDHCTNIAEDIVYIKSGQIVRHRNAV